MKICMVMCWGFEKLDGSNLRVYFLLRELLGRNHEVTVIHSTEEQAEYTRRHLGCGAIGVGQSINRWDPVREKMKSYYRFVTEARKTVSRLKCDVIFGISLINSMVAIAKKDAARRIMYVDFMSRYFQYGYPDGLKNKMVFRMGKTLETHTVSKADKVLMITGALRDLVDSRYHGKIEIVPDGADTEMFRPGLNARLIRDEYNLKDEFVIGYQGGIEPHDGLQFLAQAAPRIIKEAPATKFLIAGRGSHLDSIRQTVKDNGTEKNWIFTGWVEFNKVPYFMAATDLNVVPIPKHPATQGVITFRLLESMAGGVNIIASDMPGIREVADESMIDFTCPEDTVRFAKDILRVMSKGKDELKKQRAAARKKVETLDWRRIAEKDADFVEGRALEPL
ncbi:MAG: glycosyltransferase [Deltaproteobacteria bacterium]|nr:glycosyltransferase [Deltaproteobacteria bacterium]